MSCPERQDHPADVPAFRRGPYQTTLYDIGERPRRRADRMLRVAIVAAALLLAVVGTQLCAATLANLRSADCRKNMRAIALAAQAYRLKSPDGRWPASVADMTGAGTDLLLEPECPLYHTRYTLTKDPNGGIVIACPGGHGTFALDQSAR